MAVKRVRLTAEFEYDEAEHGRMSHGDAIEKAQQTVHDEPHRLAAEVTSVE